MKSTIRVELGTLNKPVIRMRVNKSDDVRDHLFKQFNEGFGYTSNLCFTTFDYHVEGLDALLEIEAIHPVDHDKFINRLTSDQCAAIIPLAFMVLGDEQRSAVLTDIMAVELDKVMVREPSLQDQISNILFFHTGDDAILAIRKLVQPEPAI